MGILREWRCKKSDIPLWFEPVVLDEISNAMRVLDEYTALIRSSESSESKTDARKKKVGM